MVRAPILSVTLVALLAACQSEAQQLTLTMQDGLVTLDAGNVPIRQVLTEWARVGDVTIVNGDKVVGPAVKLTMPGVSERQALDALLRGVSGYMLAARPASKAGLSVYDRILILPTSSTPPPPPVVCAPGGQVRTESQAPSYQPQIVGRPTMSQTGKNEGDLQVPFAAGIQAGARPPSAPSVVFPTPNGLVQTRQPRSRNSRGAATTSAGNPFGTPAGFGRPGVVTPVPPPSEQQIITTRQPEPTQ
jgi:hypothetical protein